MFHSDKTKIMGILQKRAAFTQSYTGQVQEVNEVKEVKEKNVKKSQKI